MTPEIKIYLADDHQLLIDGMLAVLKTTAGFNVVGFSLNGLGLVEDAVSKKTDILVMDINMPQKDGLEVLRDLSVTELPFKIIILSSYDDLKLVREVMKLGASGYLTKQCAGENIVEAIQVVNSGEEYFCKTISDKIFNTFAKNNPKVNTTAPSFNTNLTNRELDIIRLISLEYSGKEISEELFISQHTVESHRKNLMKKLEVKSSVGLVKYAIKHNLVNL
ncbi:response regulator transcription factor [Flavobacterium sp. MAH-1]|uniref:Response regulator transcription factor n=1 Tax=Flavobacterium agri TaxID=2743471 RepID=A0A7Y8XYS4_9FLAO|nr:response regulator transcription factor [Flavobacterium agri]NUY79404.1 response regulator transcription factor [Flavobacterium agri]NYA69429.1 response regulator transcription factor [Flavobacterium agri]